MSPTKSTSYKPDGFHSVTPYLTVERAGELIDFMVRAFDADVVLRMEQPDGRLSHAQVRIGDSMIEISDPAGPWKAMPTALHLYVPDTDATYRRALAAGATSVTEPADAFYGDRTAAVRDGSGNNWYLATHVLDLSEAELAERVAAQANTT